jgi:hypothetical protein
MISSYHLRIARPAADLLRTERMYRSGLDLCVLDRFEDHAGFDGVMLGHKDAHFHLEFTQCRRHPVSPSPSPEDLLVLYIPSSAQFQALVTKMENAGFKRVASFNPYWDDHGCTFADHDGYRIVLCNDEWNGPHDAGMSP